MGFNSVTNRAYNKLRLYTIHSYGGSDDSDTSECDHRKGQT